MKKMFAAAAVIVAVSATACKKTGEGEYTVEKPVVGTVTDTVHTPVVETSMESTTVAVPKVVTDSTTIKVPHVEVKRP